MIRIRKAGEEDAHAVWDIRNLAIKRQCIGHYPAEVLAIWTSGEMPVNFAEEVARSFFVVTRADHVVGTGTVNLESGKIDGIFVHPDHMGTGVGKKMMSHLESLARCHGVVQLHLESTLNAAPFYRACGFCGDEIAVYISPRGITLACIPMAKTLGN